MSTWSEGSTIKLIQTLNVPQNIHCDYIQIRAFIDTSVDFISKPFNGSYMALYVSHPNDSSPSNSSWELKYSYSGWAYDKDWMLDNSYSFGRPHI